jgi:hypothetical protein
MTIAQRIPIKKVTHFLTVAESMHILGSGTIKISDKACSPPKRYYR